MQTDLQRDKRAVIVPHFVDEYLNQEYINRYEWHVAEAIRYLQLAGRQCEIFVPDSHKVITTRLLRNNRLIEVTDSGLSTSNRTIHHLQHFERLNARDMEISFADNPHILEHLNYKYEYYWRLRTLLWRTQPIPRFSAVQATHPVYLEHNDES